MDEITYSSSGHHRHKFYLLLNHMLSKKHVQRGSIAIALVMLVLVLLPWQETAIMTILRIIFGSLYMLFLPWYRLTLSFFHKKELDLLERFALSFALSISVVPLLTFYISLIGIKITQLSIRWVVTLIILANALYLWYNKRNHYD